MLGGKLLPAKKDIVSLSRCLWQSITSWIEHKYKEGGEYEDEKATQWSQEVYDVRVALVEEEFAKLVGKK